MHSNPLLKLKIKAFVHTFIYAIRNVFSLRFYPFILRRMSYLITLNAVG